MKVYNRYTTKLIGEFNISPGANLSGADLSGANLSDADLSDADLSDADLSDADLSGADLFGANLSSADLSGAILSRADLSDANLSGANLSGANLSSANLSDANLFGADLRCANLSGANLFGANLRGANLKDAKLPKFQIPQRKSLIVFKKLEDDRIAKLRIPCRAKRTASLVGNKCRAERAIVLEIYSAFGSKIKYQTGRSLHDSDFVYEVGKEVRPNNGYEGDIRQECMPGIHFFMTEEEARGYF